MRLEAVPRWLHWLVDGGRSKTPLSIGEQGERMAERYLRRQGMRIVGRQVRIGGGEIDLVAVDGQTVVFVEVKTRRSDAAGHPAEAVNDDKQRKLSRCALAFLRRHDLLECAARFDVIAILGSPDQPDGLQIEHLPNAFQPTAVWQMFA